MERETEPVLSTAELTRRKPSVRRSGLASLNAWVLRWYVWMVTGPGSA